MDEWRPMTFEGNGNVAQCFDLPSQMAFEKNELYREFLSSKDYNPEWGIHEVKLLYLEPIETNPYQSPISIVCEFCGLNPYVGVCHTRIMLMANLWKDFNEKNDSPPHFDHTHMNEYSPSWTENGNGYENDFDQPIGPIDSFPPPSFEERFSWKLDEFSNELAAINDKPRNFQDFDASLGDRICDKLDEIRKMVNESNFSCEEMCENSLDHNAPVFTFFDEVEVEEQGLEKFELEGCDLVDLPSEGDSSLMLPNLIHQPLQENVKKLEKSNTLEVEKEPKIVDNPILLDNEDLMICKELAYQGECCYIDESIFEIIDEGEPLNSHFSSKCIELPFAQMEESEKTCLESFSNQVERDSVEEEKWYKVEFVEEKATCEIHSKSKPFSPFSFYKRFLTLEEISFFWYRDGYSENLAHNLRSME